MNLSNSLTRTLVGFYNLISLFALRRLRPFIIVFFVLLLTLFGGGSPLAFGVGISTAQAAGMKMAPKPNHYDPKAGTTSTLHAAPKPNYPYLPPAPTTPQSIQHPIIESMQSATIALTPGKAAHFLGSDTRLELTIPANAVTAADVTQAGGKLSLQITQIAPASGSSAGGSGHVSFGTYQFQFVDAKGTLISHGLRKPLTAAWHYTSKEGAFDLTHTFVVLNGARPKGTKSAPTPSGVKSVNDTFGQSTTQNVSVDTAQHTLTVQPLITTPSSSMSFNTDSPVAAFGKPDIFNVDLNAGALTADNTLDIPAGPGGLTPPVSLSYSSESVTEQHNTQAAAGWVGEGWSMTGGSISWAEHNVLGNGGTNWESSWQLSDPFGTSSELIPPAINVSTYYDDTPNAYCASGTSTAYPCPIQWHTANESHAKIYAYVGPLTISEPAHPLCYRVYLPNGIMEEFGCTQDSLQYYYSTAQQVFFVSNWLIDLITDPQGNQIHYTYQQDTQSITDSKGAHSFQRDVVMGTIEYDSPSCHNATTMCTGSAWAPLARVNFVAGHNPSRTTGSVVATASSTFEAGTWALANITDGTANGWTSNNSLSTNHSEWVQLDLEAPQTFNEVDLQPRDDGLNTGYGFPIDFTIATSIDGATWTNVVTKTGYAMPTSGAVQRFSFTPQTARFVRVTGTNLRANPYDSNNYRMQFAEMEMRNTTNLALGATTTASSSLEGSGWAAADAVDGVRTSMATTNGWTSNGNVTTNHTEWIQLNLGTAKNVNELDLAPRTTTPVVGFPIDFTIATSTDGSTWTNVVTQTSYPVPSGTQMQRFTFPTQSAQYIKITGTNLRPNPGESNAYRMQFAEIEAYNGPNLALSPIAACNTGASLRCDDPFDLSGSSGLPAPQVQSTFVLNDIQVQTRSSSTGTWNTLRDYQLSYEQSSPTTMTDPVTGKVESVAGMLDLTQLQEVGDDGSTTLPPRVFGYTTQANSYEDDLFTPVPTTNCGPSGWNTGNGSGCLLWSQSFANNDRYLSSASNGLGMQQTFSWVNARDNAHGVPGGGSNTANPLYCNSHQSGYPCNEADDQNWSHIVLTQGSDTVVRLTQNGQGGTQTTTPVTSTSGYSYLLSYPLAAQPCSDCTAGMYWGNQNDGDYLDYYNNKFMGFTQASVSNPDGSVDVHKYYATEGFGLYDTGQVTCYETSPCHNAPWWDLGNAAHGHEYESDSYDINGTTLIKKSTSTYMATCPPTGVSPTPPVTTDKTYTWDGRLVSALDHNNPVAVCDVQETQSVAATLDGSTNSVTSTTATSYDAYGRVIQTTDSSNSGTTSSPTSITHKTFYSWNDALNVPAQSESTSPQTISGLYLIDFAAETTSEDSSGNRYGCQYTGYDGQSAAAGQISSLTLGEATSNDSYTACGNSGNGNTPSGLSRATSAYDTYGNVIATTDADANGGISSHKGCTLNSTLYTDCTVYDGTYNSLVASSTNALNQTSSTSYAQTAGGGYGIWPLTSTDSNGQTSTYTYDALGRMTSQTLPGEGTGLTTKSWTYTTWCSGTAAQAPCIEVDETARLNGTTTVTSRAFYDGQGRLVETRDPGPGGQDVVAYAYYDASGHMVYEGNSYFVTAYSGGPGAAAYSIPDSTQVGTTTSYDGLERPLVVTDPLSQPTTTSYSVVCAPAGTGDTGCYEQTKVVDALNHQHATLTDGFGREGYDQRYTGNGTYTLYATTSYAYDYNGNLVTINQPSSGTTTFTFDAMSRKMAQSDPDRGSESYTYDYNGNLTQGVDARGSAGTVYAGYDGMNRLLWHNTTNSPTGAQVSYTYDSTTGGNFGVGRKTGEVFTGSGGLTGSYTYTYDARGQQTGLTTSVNGQNYTSQKTYDDHGNTLTQTYPTGEVVTNGFSSQGWLSGVTDTTGGTTTTLAGSLNYTGSGGAASQITSMQVGNNTYAYAATYDATKRLTASSLTKVSGGTLLYQTQPQYDAVGDVTSVATTLLTGTDQQQFCYDEQNRLTWAGDHGTPACSSTAITAGTLTAAQYAQAYSYDTNGRLISGSAGAYTYGASGHLHAVTSTSGGYTAAYDAMGNMTCRAPTSATTCSGTPNGQQLTYDPEGMLSAWQDKPTSPTKVVNYLYDGEGMRVAQQYTSGGTTTTTAYIGEIEEASTTGGTTTTTTYYYAGSDRIALAVNGIFSYLGNDQLSSASVTLAANGTPTASQLYDPYGGTRYSNGTMPTDIGFTGQKADAVTGLDYYVSRYYDPSVGQFISTDSALPSNGYNPWGLSRYAYVQGNPETLTDPDGHCWPLCTMIIGAVIGGAIGAATSVATQAASGHGVNWGQVGKDAAVGAISGAISGLAGPEAGPITKAAVGALANAGGQVVSNILDHKPLGDGVLTAAAVGAGSELGLAVVGKFGGKFLGSVFKRGSEAVCGGESFSSDTQVATPTGEQAISTLKVGDAVQAYDPQTNQPSTQTVQNVFVNHDTDLVDVKLHTAATTTSTNNANGGANTKEASTKNPTFTNAKPQDETVHTTAKHPWLTTDKRWVKAGDLYLGEQVQELDGSVAVVVSVSVVPHPGNMYDLTISNLHTFAVGDDQFVVHNCNPQTLRFTQRKISPYHYDEEGNIKYTVQQNIDSLGSGDLNPNDLPAIRVFKKTAQMNSWDPRFSNLRNNRWYTLDNRRVYEFQQAGITDVQCNIVTNKRTLIRQAYKFTTQNGGRGIRVSAGRGF